MSLPLSKYHIVGNHVSWLNYVLYVYVVRKCGYKCCLRVNIEDLT